MQVRGHARHAPLVPASCMRGHTSRRKCTNRASASPAALGARKRSNSCRTRGSTPPSTPCTAARGWISECKACTTLCASCQAQVASYQAQAASNRAGARGFQGPQAAQVWGHMHRLFQGFKQAQGQAPAKHACGMSRAYTCNLFWPSARSSRRNQLQRSILTCGCTHRTGLLHARAASHIGAAARQRI